MFVVLLIVFDNALKFRDNCLNHSGEIRPKAIGDGIFGDFFSDNCRPEVASDIIYGTGVGLVSMDVRVKFGDSNSNRS